MLIFVIFVSFVRACNAGKVCRRVVQPSCFPKRVGTFSWK
jgi:hypothetical protein